MKLLPKPKYIVLETNGIDLTAHPVKQVHAYNAGLVMRYINRNNEMDTVYVGHKYKPIIKDGVALIGKRSGNNSAAQVCPPTTITTIDGKDYAQATDIIGPPTDPDCPGEDLSLLVQSDFLGTGARTLYTSFRINWKLIGIIAAVAAIAIVIMKLTGTI